MNLTPHQQKQIEVIDTIEKQVQTDTVQFSTVTPMQDYENDARICLTSVHFPSEQLLKKIQQTLISPLRKIFPNAYYYPPESMHMTIKNVRVIHDPPTFDDHVVSTAKRVFSTVIPKHHAFRVFFYRLLFFPNNLALIGTTDPELDAIYSDLTESMSAAGIPSDSVYTNTKYIFSNMTLARFYEPPSQTFRKKVVELSRVLQFDPYLVDSVSLVSGNAVLKNKTIYGKWELK